LNSGIEYFPILHNNILYRLDPRTRYFYKGKEVFIAGRNYLLHNNGESYADRQTTFFLIDNSGNRYQIPGNTIFKGAPGSGMYFYGTEYRFFRNPYNKNMIIIISLTDSEIGGDLGPWRGERFSIFSFNIDEVIK
jgi:hypothetical protein